MHWFYVYLLLRPGMKKLEVFFKMCKVCIVPPTEGELACRPSHIGARLCHLNHQRSYFVSVCNNLVIPTPNLKYLMLYLEIPSRKKVIPPITTVCDCKRNSSFEFGAIGDFQRAFFCGATRGGKEDIGGMNIFSECGCGGSF